MFSFFSRKLFGSANDRIIEKLKGTVQKINEKETEIQALSDSELRGQTEIFIQQLKSGKKLDDLIIDAFATVREASRRITGERHYDEQLMGGLILHSGKIAEMKTGEGKTLVSTLPTYLNALENKGAHVVTVNDYLAKRDALWMSKIYDSLGLDVGYIVSNMSDEERKKAYQCHITYGTNNEFGFDYLRDNMKFNLDEQVMRGYHFAIVDEVDSILIDEARTPLIISGEAEQSSDLYMKINQIIHKLRPEHYEIDEKGRNILMTDQGIEACENHLEKNQLINHGGLYDTPNIHLLHYLNQSLKAHHLFSKNTDYIVKSNKIIIIDEFTGRAMEGRRFSEGLHQALEAKEKVKIQKENQTLASVTFQNYFRLYKKLSGMTGTAMTEMAEFDEIYQLPVVSIPTHQPVVRQDHHDEIYRTTDEKWRAIVEQIEQCHEKKQPLLVGTVSIEKSEIISRLLKKKNIPHEILNAKNHAREAEIIAQAGSPGAVTIATNMAGRGTDIKLGGNAQELIKQKIQKIEDPEKQQALRQEIMEKVQQDQKIVKQAGGLYVIGTERHESRRIDNQLRGRAGRQGDPGASKFYLSLQDDLMRIFGSDRMDGMLQKLGLKEDESIYHPWVNKAIEKAQEKVESRNFDIRKSLLKFDNVMNHQRQVIYEQRHEFMSMDHVNNVLNDMLEEVIESLVHDTCPPNVYPEQWDLKALEDRCLVLSNTQMPLKEWIDQEGITDEKMIQLIGEHARGHIEKRRKDIDPEIVQMLEKNLLMQILDQSWKNHLLNLDQLRQGIGLRAYGQQDPLNEYKREAFNLFQNMLISMREKIIEILMRVEFNLSPPQKENTQFQGTPRNALCPCGSSKKYKHCHGRPY